MASHPLAREYPQHPPPPDLPRRPSSEWAQDEMLWEIRTANESAHRYETYLYGVTLTYMPSIRDIHHLPMMKIEDFADTCNKSVPVYIMDGPKRLVSTVLHNYISCRWFHPYRSEIERQRFICKFINPQHLPDEAVPSQSTINTLISMNQAICTEVEGQHRVYEEKLALTNGEETVWGLGLQRVMELNFHIIQPLFRALLIIISPKNYNYEDSKTVGGLSVFLVRTGVEDCLSAPITFEPIADKIGGYAGDTKNAVKTTLETAVDFVMNLEAREAAVFGLQPHPVAAGKVDKRTARW